MERLCAGCAAAGCHPADEVTTRPGLEVEVRRNLHLCVFVFLWPPQVVLRVRRFARKLPHSTPIDQSGAVANPECMTARALVLRAAGTNCERETAWTLTRAGAEA